MAHVRSCLAPAALRRREPGTAARYRRSGSAGAGLLIGASILDIALGILSILPRRAPFLWTAQILLVLVYTAIISVFLPQLWLEPFGPVAKNVPILALLLLLRQLETRR